MPVTAGSISIARRINTGDYSHTEAKVELHYTAEGGEDIKVLGAQASHAALVDLAQVLATVVKIDHTPEIHVAAPEPEAAAQSVEAAGSVKRQRRTRAEMEAARVAEMDAALTAASAASGDPLPADPVNFAGAEITDKELNNLCNETMLRIKNKVNIQAVIGEYTQGAVSTIPQSARAAFMQKLQALQP